jgi:hypothetical protein
VPHFFKLYRGTHSDRIGERLEDAALPFLGRALTSGGERAGRTSGERWRRPAAGPGTPSP